MRNDWECRLCLYTADPTFDLTRLSKIGHTTGLESNAGSRCTNDTLHWREDLKHKQTILVLAFVPVFLWSRVAILRAQNFTIRTHPPIIATEYPKMSQINHAAF